MATPSIDVMILGALKEQPLSAYDMDKTMEARAVRKWVRVSSPSIYRNLIKLREDGFVKGEITREGSAPEKTIYTITDKGQERFDELMREVAHAPVRVDFDFVSVIANLYVTDEATGRELLHTLRRSHQECAEKLRASVTLMPRLEARATIELCAQTYELVANWLETYERNFYRDDVAPEQRGWLGDIPISHRPQSLDDAIAADAQGESTPSTPEEEPGDEPKRKADDELKCESKRGLRCEPNDEPKRGLKRGRMAN